MEPVIDEENDVKAAEEQAEIEGEADTDFEDEEQVEASQAHKEAGDSVGMPAEVAAVNTDNETAKQATEASKPEVKKALVKKRKRSKRYTEVLKSIDKDKVYNVDEALDALKKTANTKFESSVEAHIKLIQKKGKKKGNEEIGRGILHLPHGLGKQLKVTVIDEKQIEEIAKTKKVNFDVAIATPTLMPKLGKIAKILGTKGKMPNPKFGTVTENPEKVKEEIEKGRIEYRVDATGVIHQMIGKVSWDNKDLEGNLHSLLQIFAKKNVQSIYLSTTMGPSVRIES